MIFYDMKQLKMVSAILIACDKSYKVDHQMISPPVRNSFTYTGERWAATIDKVTRKLRYTDDFGAVFELGLPDDQDNFLLLNC